MTRKTLLTFAMLTAFSAGSALAAAQSDAAAKPQRVSLDANGDGFVDRAEAATRPRLAGHFDHFDTDRDGRLSKQELPVRGARGRHGAGHAMKALDTDGDRRISRAEAADGRENAAERFARMDLNNDGYLDRTDRQLRMQQRSDAWFTAADVDGNGQLSRAEYDAAHAKRREGREARMERKQAQ